MSFIKKYNPDILSAHVEEVRDPTCIPSKTLWVKKNLGLPNNRINLVRRFQKKTTHKQDIIVLLFLLMIMRRIQESLPLRGRIHHTSTSNTIRRFKKLGLLISPIINSTLL